MTAILLAVLVAQQMPSDAVPGSLNAAVTQTNIHETICRVGWTREVRPPRWWSQAHKHRLLHAAGMPSSEARLFELDHRVPLELGGAPEDQKNLWLQPLEGPGALEKDQLENYVNRRVCSGSMTLREGRAVFLGDWWQAYKHFGLAAARKEK